MDSVGMISVSSRLHIRTQSLTDPIHHLGQVPTKVVGVAQREDIAAAGTAAHGEDGGLIGFGVGVGEEARGELAVERDRGSLPGKRGPRLMGAGDLLRSIVRLCA